MNYRLNHSRRVGTSAKEYARESLLREKGLPTARQKRFWTRLALTLKEAGHEEPTRPPYDRIAYSNAISALLTQCKKLGLVAEYEQKPFKAVATLKDTADAGIIMTERLVPDEED
jgi:hypothetical protein